MDCYSPGYCDDAGDVAAADVVVVGVGVGVGVGVDPGVAVGRKIGRTPATDWARIDLAVGSSTNVTEPSLNRTLMPVPRAPSLGTWQSRSNAMTARPGEPRVMPRPAHA